MASNKSCAWIAGCPLSPANLLTVGISASYLVGYSGYDKATKQFLIRDKLAKLFSFADPRYSVKELNKAVGLTAMTIGNTVAIGCLFQGIHRPLLSGEAIQTLTRRTVWLVLAHASFSSWEYRQRFFNAKALSMGLGLAAFQLWLALNAAVGNRTSSIIPSWYPVLTAKLPVLVAAASVLSTAHVFTMERNSTSKKVEMRPVGYWGLIISGIIATASVVALGVS